MAATKQQTGLTPSDEDDLTTPCAAENERGRSMGGDTAEHRPVWRLIGEDALGSAPLRFSTPVALAGKGWKSDLASAVTTVDRGGMIFFTFDRGLARAALRLLAHGEWQRPVTPSTSGVRRALSADGMEVLQVYALWPSAEQVRLAVSEPSGRRLGWVQRSGVLGGGGSRIWRRALARSRLFSPFVHLLRPSVAVVARRP